MKHYSLLVAALAILVATGSAHAETTDTTAPKPYPSSIAPVLKEERKDMIEKRQESTTLIKEKRTDFLQEAKEDRTDLQTQRKEQLGNLKESRAALEQQIKERREALKADIEKIKKERLTVRKQFVETRFAEVVKMLTAAQGRVETKIDELEDKGGYDLDSAKEHLGESKDALAKAVALLETLKKTTVSDTNETTAAKPRETAKQIEALLKESREHLREAIAAIKSAVEEHDEDDNSDDSTGDSNE